jgi:hypothetical protein
MTDVEREREAAPTDSDFLIEEGTADAGKVVPLPPFPPLLEVEAEAEVDAAEPPPSAAAAFPLPFAAAFARGLACCLGLAADVD